MHPKCWTMVELQNFGCTQSFKRLKTGCTPWKLTLISHGAPCIKLWNDLISFTLFCFASFYAWSQNPTWGPNRNTHWYQKLQKLQYPFFMTLITLLWLSVVALFWQHVFTRSVQQMIKAPVKVNPFSVVLLSDWSGLLCTDQSISGMLSVHWQIKCLF